VLIIAAVSFGVLCAFSALVIDLGYVGLVEAQLQTATDAGALAGARLLNGTAEGMVNARAAAVLLADSNDANGTAVDVDPNMTNDPAGGVVLGVWDGAAFGASTVPADVNAVLVRSSRGDLRPFFSKVAFGTTRLGAGVHSIAVAGPLTGASEVPWYLPFSLPECLWETWDDNTLQDMTFVLNPPGTDNTGWTAIGDNPTASWIRDFFASISGCMKSWATDGTVPGSCALASTSDQANHTNGEIDSGLQYIAKNIGSEGIPWDSSLWGTLPAQQPNSSIKASDYGMVYAGPIPVFQSGSEYCSGSGGSWTTTEPIAFFVWAVIYDVVNTGGASSKTVYMRLDLDTVYNVGDWGGGDDHGVLSETPAALVQ